MVQIYEIWIISQNLLFCKQFTFIINYSLLTTFTTESYKWSIIFIITLIRFPTPHSDLLNLFLLFLLCLGVLVFRHEFDAAVLKCQHSVIKQDTKDYKNESEDFLDLERLVALTLV